MQEEEKATILDRSFEPLLPEHQTLLTFAQWNLLSDQLALDFPRVQEKWEFRKKLYEQELKRVNADIYFLQEVDHPDEILELLPMDEYQSHFIQKKGWHQDGVFLLFRTSRFEEKEIIKSAYKSEKCGKQNYIIAALKDKITGVILLAGVTHFKSKKPHTLVRTLEAKELIGVLSELEKKYDQPPSVLGLDMNDEPLSEPHQIFADFGLRSSYEILRGKEEITTFKSREVEGPVTAHTIDYILVKEGKSKLQPLSSYRLPSEEQMGKEKGLPSGRYPSDHLMLGLKVKQALSHKI